MSAVKALLKVNGLPERWVTARRSRTAAPTAMTALGPSRLRTCIYRVEGMTTIAESLQANWPEDSGVDANVGAILCLRYHPAVHERAQDGLRVQNALC